MVVYLDLLRYDVNQSLRVKTCAKACSFAIAESSIKEKHLNYDIEKVFCFKKNKVCLSVYDGDLVRLLNHQGSDCIFDLVLELKVTLFVMCYWFQMDAKNNLTYEEPEEMASPKLSDWLKNSTPWRSPIRHGSMMPSTPLAWRFDSSEFTLKEDSDDLF